MKQDERDENAPSRQVERKLDYGRRMMKDVGERLPEKRIPGTPSGYLDTQLFPGKKKPYHE